MIVKMYDWLYSTIGNITEQVGILGLAIILLTLWVMVSVIFEKRAKEG